MKAVGIMLLPAFTMVAGGLFYDFTFSDFVGGYTGCATTCPTNIDLSSFFNASIFNPLLHGDFIGFITSLFTSPQTPLSLISFIIGGVLLALSLGLSGSISVLGTGISIAMTDSGTRMAQSLGIAFLMWAFVSAFFGLWPTIITGWGMGTIITFLLPSIFFYGAYLQGKSIT